MCSVCAYGVSLIPTCGLHRLWQFMCICNISINYILFSWWYDDSHTNLQLFIWSNQFAPLFVRANIFVSGYVRAFVSYFVIHFTPPLFVRVKGFFTRHFRTFVSCFHIQPNTTQSKWSKPTHIKPNQTKPNKPKTAKKYTKNDPIKHSV